VSATLTELPPHQRAQDLLRADAHISRLRLSEFRAVASADLSCARGAIVIVGANGGGKTSVLEAVSLLAPGRGLRRAKPGDITRRGGNTPGGWAVSAVVGAEPGIRIGTGLQKDKLGRERRLYRVNGEPAKAAELAQALRLLWVTPATERLFEDAKETRRAFFDHLVCGLDPAHQARLTRYDRARAERLQVLIDGTERASWLGGLEEIMAAEGAAITLARADALAHLAAEIARNALAHEAHFPRAELALEGGIERLFAEYSQAEAERHFAAELRGARARDGAAGKSLVGPHRSDLRARLAASGLPAEMSSTGEQKALLYGIVLAQARLIAKEFGAPPVILLDAVAAHLDEARRDRFLEALRGLNAQVFLTGANLAPFAAIAEAAQIFEAAGGQIRPAVAKSLSRIQDR